MWFRGSREQIFPIKVEGFLLAAKVIHKDLIPLERVEGMWLSVAFLEGLVGRLIQRKLYEVDNLGRI